MPQPNSSGRITSPPAVPGQPYVGHDADHSDTGAWREVMAGPCNINTGRCEGEEAWDGPPPWRQT